MAAEEPQSRGGGDTPVEEPISSFELVWDNFDDGGYDRICNPDRYATNVCIHDTPSYQNNGFSSFGPLSRRGICSGDTLAMTGSDAHDAIVASTKNSDPLKSRCKNVFSNSVNFPQTTFFEEDDEFLSICSTEYFSCNSYFSTSDVTPQKRLIEQQQIECVFSKVKLNLNIIVTDLQNKVACQKWIKEQNELKDSMRVRASNSSLSVATGSISTNYSLMEWLKNPFSNIPCRSVSEIVLNTSPSYPDDLPSIKRSESPNIHLTIDDFILKDEYIEDMYLHDVVDLTIPTEAIENEDWQTIYTSKLKDLICGETREEAGSEDDRKFPFSSTSGDVCAHPNVETKYTFGKTVDDGEGVEISSNLHGDQEGVSVAHDNKMLRKDTFDDLYKACAIEIDDSDVNLDEMIVAREKSESPEQGFENQTCEITLLQDENKKTPFAFYFDRKMSGNEHGVLEVDKRENPKRSSSSEIQVSKNITDEQIDEAVSNVLLEKMKTGAGQIESEQDTIQMETGSSVENTNSAFLSADNTSESFTNRVVTSPVEMLTEDNVKSGDPSFMIENRLDNERHPSFKAWNEQQEEKKTTPKSFSYKRVSRPCMHASSDRRLINKVQQTEKKKVFEEKQSRSLAKPDLNLTIKTLCKKIVYAARVEIAEDRLSLEYRRQRAERKIHLGTDNSMSTLVGNESTAGNSAICKVSGQCKCNRCVCQVKQFPVSKIPVKSGTDTPEKEYTYKKQQNKKNLKDASEVIPNANERLKSSHAYKCMQDRIFIPKSQNKTSKPKQKQVKNQSKDTKPKKTTDVKVLSLFKDKTNNAGRNDQNITQMHNVTRGNPRFLSWSILPADFMCRVSEEHPAPDRNGDNEIID